MCRSDEGGRAREDDSSIARLCGDIVTNKVGAERAVIRYTNEHRIFIQSICKVSLLAGQIEILAL